MISTFHQLREMLEKRLHEAGLTEFIDWQSYQFLDLGGEAFIEVVVRDASRLEDAKRVVELAAEEIKTKGISVESVVRAQWEVVSVDYQGPSYAGDPPQTLAADRFRVILRSGPKQHVVSMDVSFAAIELLKRKLGLRDSDAPQGLPEMVAPIVQKFVEQNLSRGGTSYWDPLQDPRVELSATDMSFLMGQSTAFEELRQAIWDAFDPPVLDSFLVDLSVTGVKNVRDFDAILPELSNMLGGAYRKGDTFSTSATELYRRLDRTEQELLKKYYQGKIDQLERDPHFASLAKKYHFDEGPLPAL